MKTRTLLEVVASTTVCVILFWASGSTAGCSSDSSAPAGNAGATSDEASTDAGQGDDSPDVVLEDANGEPFCDVQIDLPPNHFALPLPTGPYGIARGGRRTMVDPTRTLEGALLDAGLEGGTDGEAGPEDSGTDAAVSRPLGVEIWYPSEGCLSSETVPYLDAEENKVIGLETVRVHTHASTKVPFASSLGPRPLLIFSPGYSGLPRLYTAYIEEVVSRGYVVAAVSHTLWTPVTTFADGSTIPSNKPLSAVGSEEQIEQYAAIWLADARFVLDELEKVSVSDPLGEVDGHLDLSKVGIFGHSFGGTTSLSLLVTDQRVKAALSLVGTVRGPAHGAVTAKSFFIFNEKLSPANHTFFYQATGSAYWAVLDGAGHNFYSDIPFLTREFELTGTDIGSLDPDQGSRELRGYLTAFFDFELMGISSPILDGPTTAYPDVLFYERKP